MKIKASKDICIKISSNNLKTWQLIEFLISKGYKTSKETFKTSLSDLIFNGQKIESCIFDNWKKEFIINFKK